MDHHQKVTVLFSSTRVVLMYKVDLDELADRVLNNAEEAGDEHGKLERESSSHQGKN